MQRFIAIMIGTFFLFTVNAKAIEWTGSLEPRYFKSSFTQRVSGPNVVPENLDVSETILELMAELGLSGGSKNLAWGLKFRTDGGAPNKVHAPYGMYGNNSPVTLSGLTSGMPITFSEAWARYRRNFGFGFINLTVGQQKPVFMTGDYQLFMDSDVTLGGLGWSWRRGAYGVRAAQYVFMGNSKLSGGSLGSLYSVQGTLRWRFTRQIRSTFALGLHFWSGSESRVEEIGNGDAKLTRVLPVNNPLRRGSLGEDGEYLSMPTSFQIQLLGKTSLPYDLRAELEIVMGSAQQYDGYSGTGSGATGSGVEADDDGKLVKKGSDDVGTFAWLLGVTYKKIKKVGDYSASLAFGAKGLGAVYSSFTDDHFSPGYSGLMLKGKYKLTPSIMVGGDIGLFSELSPADQAGETAKAFSTSGQTSADFESASYSYFQLSASMKF